jgi:hypothetical protein
MRCPCGGPAHPEWVPCKERTGLTGQEMAEAERRFERGLFLSAIGRRMGPMDPDDTSDLWQDGW